MHFQKEPQIFGDIFRLKKASIRYFGSRRPPDPDFGLFFVDFCTILVVFLYGFWRAIQGVRNDVAPEVFLTPRARGVNN